MLNNNLKKIEVKNLTNSTKEFIKKNRIKGIILGCTELPLAFPKSKFKDVKIFDSLDILADAIITHLKTPVLPLLVKGGARGGFNVKISL